MKNNTSPVNDTLSAGKTASVTPEANPLRDLARRAVGRSGADIERMIREARQKVRRAGRKMSWDDLERALRGSDLPVAADLSWRMAVHEAGHVLALVSTGDMQEVDMVSLVGPQGGFVRTRTTGLVAETEAYFASSLVVLMAGRAAELLLLGNAGAGSGGTAASDLAMATQTAVAMEISFGFGAEHPLLYRPGETQPGLLHYNRHLADRVHARLEAAQETATAIVAAHRDLLLDLAGRLNRERVLEGPSLQSLIETIRERIGGAGATSMKAEAAPQPISTKSVKAAATTDGSDAADDEDEEAEAPRQL